MSEAYNKTVNGLNSLYEDYVIATKELASTKKMLDEAKEVIGFYASEDSWLGILHKDKIICPDIRIADNGCNNIGGLKARSFLAKHEKKEEVND